MTASDRTRYRCGGCGNLTRFDVVERTRARRFLHFTLGGGAEVEDTETLEYEVESVTCRWCGATDQIETIPRLDVT